MCRNKREISCQLLLLVSRCTKVSDNLCYRGFRVLSSQPSALPLQSPQEAVSLWFSIFCYKRERARLRGLCRLLLVAPTAFAKPELNTPFLWLRREGHLGSEIVTVHLKLIPFIRNFLVSLPNLSGVQQEWTQFIVERPD
jgi:hypothetical protein